MKTTRMVPRRYIARMVCYVAAAFMMSIPLQAGAQVNVDIFSGHTSVGGGAPYSGLVGSFTSPDIQFFTNFGKHWNPFGLSSFGADMTGVLNVASDATYSFTLSSDDGSLLFIDGGATPVVDNGGMHGLQIRLGDAFLTAGAHPFEVQFFEDGMGESGVDLTLPSGVTYGTAVPEPSILLLFSVGLFGLVALRRKKSK